MKWSLKKYCNFFMFYCGRSTVINKFSIGYLISSAKIPPNFFIVGYKKSGSLLVENFQSFIQLSTYFFLFLSKVSKPLMTSLSMFLLQIKFLQRDCKFYAEIYLKLFMASMKMVWVRVLSVWLLILRLLATMIQARYEMQASMMILMSSVLFLRICVGYEGLDGGISRF